MFTATIANTSAVLPGNADNTFYDQVLSDYRRQSLFVACDISSPSYSGKAMIENADLYAYFEQEKGLSKKKYKRIMLQKLSSGEKIEIKFEDLSRSKFLKVNEIPVV